MNSSCERALLNGHLFLEFLLEILDVWTLNMFWSPGSFPRCLTSNMDAGDSKLALGDWSMWKPLLTHAYVEIRKRAAQLINKFLTSLHNLWRIFIKANTVNVFVLLYIIWQTYPHAITIFHSTTFSERDLAESWNLPVSVIQRKWKLCSWVYVPVLFHYFITDTGELRISDLCFSLKNIFIMYWMSWFKYAINNQVFSIYLKVYCHLN